MKFAYWVSENPDLWPNLEEKLLSIASNKYRQKVMAEALHGAVAVYDGVCLQKEDTFESQPILDGHLLLVGLIRLDHRADLVLSLGLSNERAARMADSQLVLSAWKKWGENAPQYLFGDFSFVVYDNQLKKSWLIRDRMMKRGLYYHYSDLALCVSSSLNSIVNFPHIERKIEPAYFVGFLSDIPVQEGVTPYQKVCSVPWATVMRFGPNGLERSWRYWDIDEEKELHLGSDEEYVEAAREVLDRSVLSHLRVQGPVCGSLTGGLDCAAIMGTARILQPERSFHAYTAYPSEDTPQLKSALIDESARAKVTASYWPDVTHHLVAIEKSRHKALAQTPSKTFMDYGRPIRNINNVDWLNQLYEESSKIGAQGYFEGSGGNMGLSWHGYSQMTHQAQQGQYARLMRELIALKRDNKYEKSIARLIWKNAISPFLSGRMRRGIGQLMGYSVWPKLSRLHFIRRNLVAQYDMEERVLSHMDNMISLRTKGGRAFRKAMMHNKNNRILELVSNHIDHCGIVTLSPLNDTKLLEFCLAVPDEQYFNKGRARWLARRVLKGRLPEETLMPQPSFQQGGNYFERMTANLDDLKQEVESLANFSSVNDVLDTEQLKKVMNNWPKDEQEWSKQGVSMLHGVHLGRALTVAQYIRWAEGGNA